MRNATRRVGLPSVVGAASASFPLRPVRSGASLYGLRGLPLSQQQQFIASSSSFAAPGRRRFHLVSSTLYAAADDEKKTNESSAAITEEEEDDEEAAELRAQQQKLQAEREAALEEKERSETYQRWVEAVRKELKAIEERVMNQKNTAKMAAPANSLERLQSLFLQSPIGESLMGNQETVVTFAGETRKPVQMPYLMLDPEWYQKTSEEERLQQVLAWKPFSARSVAQSKADQAFAEDPFRTKSQPFSGRTVTDNFRRKRLEKYLNEELANKRKVLSESELDLYAEPTQVDELKKEFRANLPLIENIHSEQASEEVVEPEVTPRDKYIKPEGFVSATDMLKFSEDKLKAEYKKALKKAKKCMFCQPAAQRPVLDPMNVSLLTAFMTASGDIIPRRHNGNCRRHQRKLSSTIKRAHNMGIFSYKYGGFTIYSPFHEPPRIPVETDDGDDDVGGLGEFDDEQYP